MRPFKSGLWLLVLVLLAIGASGMELYAQQFPYSVPQAPEFDSGGESAARTPGRRPTQNRQRSSTAENYEQQPPAPAISPSAPSAPRGTRGPQQTPPAPYVQPERPLQRSASPQPPPPQRPPGPGPGMPVASAPPQGAPQGQPQIDCSGFPMMIANAASETERRLAAREFLTCLLYSGWQFEQARQHVIATMESTRALRR